MITLANQTAIITGASRGIGEATARHLASLGVNVVLIARDAAAIERISHDIIAKGGSAIALPCDVRQHADLQDAVARTEAVFGKLDILVNNAGLIDPIARLADSDPMAWAKAVEVNLLGVYHGMHVALHGMLRAGGGTIINLSSGAATGALEGWSHYCATKAAVLSLTRCADKEYRDSGIRVIGLSPGTVATEMQVRIKASGLNPVSRLDPSVHIPAEWVAKAIAYLCTPAADPHRGTDFSLKTDAGRLEVGLPPL